MKRILTISLSLALLASTAAGTLVPRTIDEVKWSQLRSQGRLRIGQVIPPGATAEFEQLKLDVAGSQTLELVTVDNPGIDTKLFAFVGTIRHEGVTLPGYLEMWVHFADGSKYFSRTLAEAGPTAAINGTSSWRVFRVPFDCSASSTPPTRLELNLVLPGGGSVSLSPLRLVTYKDDPRIIDPMAPVGWWSPSAGSWIGGIGGALLGILCAVIALLVKKGLARLAVMATLILLATAGVGGLTAGIIAATTGQPYAVYFPLLLGGGLYILMGGLGLLTHPRLYRNAEFRRISAKDL